MDYLFYRCPVLETEKGLLENVLVIENLSDNPLFLAIRVNGYLKEIILLLKDTYHVLLHGISYHHTVTVHEVEEDINLMIPENATYYNPDFFKTLAEDDVIEWRYDDGTLEADKVTTFERPLEPWEEDN